MTITTTTLTRAAGLAAVAGGLLFIAVQVNHPVLNADFTTTTEYAVRETMKIVMAVLSLIGITGIYLRQVKQTGVLGLIGYVVLGVGYLGILSTQVVAVFVLPILATLAGRVLGDTEATTIFVPATVKSTPGFSACSSGWSMWNRSARASSGPE